MGYVYFASFNGDKLILKWQNTDAVLKRYNAKEDIIGTWQNINGKITTELTFNNDMKMDLKIYVSGIESKPTVPIPDHYYKFIDKNRIETTGAVIYTIKKLSSDRLILYRADWEKDILYKKISK